MAHSYWYITYIVVHSTCILDDGVLRGDVWPVQRTPMTPTVYRIHVPGHISVIPRSTALSRLFFFDDPAVSEPSTHKANLHYMDVDSPGAICRPVRPRITCNIMNNYYT